MACVSFHGTMAKSSNNEAFLKYNDYGNRRWNNFLGESRQTTMKTQERLLID